MLSLRTTWQRWEEIAGGRGISASEPLPQPRTNLHWFKFPYKWMFRSKMCLTRLGLDTIHVIPEAIDVNHLISLRVLHKFYQMVLSEYFILCILLMISLLSPSKPLCPIWSLMEGNRAKITRHLDLYPNTIELHLEPQRVSQGYYWLPGFLENT